MSYAQFRCVTAVGVRCDILCRGAISSGSLGWLLSGEVCYVAFWQLGCDMLRLAEIGSDGVS